MHGLVKLRRISVGGGFLLDSQAESWCTALIPLDFHRLLWRSTVSHHTREIKSEKAGNT